MTDDVKGDLQATAANEQFANGLFETLKPAVTACDESVREVLASQQVLAQQLARLHTALNNFSVAVDTQQKSTPSSAGNENNPSPIDGTPVPEILRGYTTKIVNSKTRLKKSCVTLTKINQRLENIRALIRKKELAAVQNKVELASPQKSDVQPPPSVTSLMDLLDWD